ncbi:AGL315Wp [Eremothecium gossypii ATCC 10895]|uniref:AGL315Wp n=1 Tax=Eremothecium gossypii (strain ATCC 10895 / CBS 109.51 / FGSC 9923 / NRRL Y-1056) TaxID=284811 RepID=Q751L6_EREGS|nr:AGL315Wp [Eremothecium gossypii ATCC 10895]AAS54176.2 AGL315Wp [Eremothecium gossypii ATCC 10895]AEY98502.1 FAGL315Wp [Eremothecium gossypii FDAG1]
MNNYNQVTPLKLGGGTRARARGDAAIAAGTGSRGAASEAGSQSCMYSGKPDEPYPTSKGCSGLPENHHSSFVLLPQYHKGGAGLPQPNSTGTLGVPVNLYVPDYSLFFGAQNASCDKPQSLINWIDRQYARGMREKFGQAKMATFVDQASKLVSRAYAAGKVWQNDWLRQPDVPVFNRGSNVRPMQLVCEIGTSSVGRKRNSSSSAETLGRGPSWDGSDLHSNTTVTLGKQVDSSQAKGKKRKALSEQDRKRLRLERFASNSDAAKRTRRSDDEDYSNLNATSNHSYKFDKNRPVVGRCRTLEKRYLRLTSEPDPEKVRPLDVLEKAYEFIMNKYRSKEATYPYVCDQFKSMRQDLKVQIIENDFTLKVYQTHARIALVNGDLGEYNQCQGSIMELYERDNVAKHHFSEFMSYRILYYLLTEDHAAIDELRLKILTEHVDQSADTTIRLAFEMAQAQAQGDYHTFMKLYAQTVGPMRALVNEFIKRERLRALKTMCSAYKQLRLTFLVSELSLKDEDETFKFLNDFDLFNSVVLPEGDADTMYLNFKECRAKIMDHYNKSMKVDIKGQK